MVALVGLIRAVLPPCRLIVAAIVFDTLGLGDQGRGGRDFLPPPPDDGRRPDRERRAAQRHGQHQHVQKHHHGPVRALVAVVVVAKLEAEPDSPFLFPASRKRPRHCYHWYDHRDGLKHVVRTRAVRLVEEEDHEEQERHNLRDQNFRVALVSHESDH